MEDRKLSEKESLDIITQMINSSKRNMKVGSGKCVALLGVFYRALIGRDILFDSVYAKLYLVLGMDAHVCCRTGYFI